jgi:hypothetical protein
MLREGMERVKGPFESVARDDIVTSKRGSHGKRRSHLPRSNVLCVRELWISDDMVKFTYRILQLLLQARGIENAQVAFVQLVEQNWYGNQEILESITPEFLG